MLPTVNTFLISIQLTYYLIRVNVAVYPDSMLVYSNGISVDFTSMFLFLYSSLLGCRHSFHVARFPFTGDYTYSLYRFH